MNGLQKKDDDASVMVLLRESGDVGVGSCSLLSLSPSKIISQ